MTPLNDEQPLSGIPTIGAPPAPEAPSSQISVDEGHRWSTTPPASTASRNMPSPLNSTTSTESSGVRRFKLTGLKNVSTTIKNLIKKITTEISKIRFFSSNKGEKSKTTRSNETEMVMHFSSNSGAILDTLQIAETTHEELKKALVRSTAEKIQKMVDSVLEAGIDDVEILHESSPSLEENRAVKLHLSSGTTYTQGGILGSGSFKDATEVQDAAGRSLALLTSLAEGTEDSIRGPIDKGLAEVSRQDMLKELVNIKTLLNHPAIAQAANKAGLPEMPKLVIVIGHEATSMKMGLLMPKADTTGMEVAESDHTSIALRRQYVEELGNAMVLMNEAKYAHRDIHLGNVLISNGHAHFCDFSTMTHYESTVERQEKKFYINNRGSLKQSDKHSFAMAAFSMLTGFRPTTPYIYVLPDVFARPEKQPDRANREERDLRLLTDKYGKENGEKLFKAFKELIELPIENQGSREGTLESKMEISEFLKIVSEAAIEPSEKKE